MEPGLFRKLFDGGHILNTRVVHQYVHLIPFLIQPPAEHPHLVDFGKVNLHENPADTLRHFPSAIQNVD